MREKSDSFSKIVCEDICEYIQLGIKPHFFIDDGEDICNEIS